MFENLFSERGLSLDRLRVLVEVHDAGSIAAAVPGDPVRQSQYSRQIRELSEYFGCDVAQRSGKVLRLTPQGARLAQLARSHLQSIEDFRAECRAESVDYTIAAGDSIIQWLVIPRVGNVLATVPDVRLATANLRTNDIVQQLSDGRIDFGILRRNAVPATLKSKPLGKLKYTLVVPRELKPPRLKVTLAHALAHLPIASQKSDGQFIRRLREIANASGTDLTPSLLCESFPQSLSAVRTGCFAAILPKIATSDLKEPRYLMIEDKALAVLHRDLALAWNPRLSHVRPIANKLADALSRQLAIDR
ncbi:LysR family transcriptional regulator [Synoicihabitans lomoniglobus]|uniref:LysR family transcriptional regulator n=1 Tax=Synoicihabitans lomoniglobus TaxID=2909285 RepID=A0AAF0CPJ5_9BACT|nr:LysR family transcriptional regulator [Opitutaceae bacterium LMO-M01]WED65074.1 LysR family transcriptional regulator [Opitutaceae bacterium LMO-M01]